MGKLALQVLLVIGVLILYIECRKNSPEKDDWHSYRRYHAKRYQTPDHEAEAKKNFEMNKKTVEDHNKKFEQGQVKHKMELNKYADWSPQELKDRNKARAPKKYLANLRKQQRRKRRMGYRGSLALAGESFPPPPQSFDWRDNGGKNFVTPAKDQGKCGDCYAFSAIGVLESQVLIKKKDEQSFSEEQVADCLYLDQNEKIQFDAQGDPEGCNGGFQPDVWQYLIDIGGVTTEDQYPYTLQKKKKAKRCTFKKDMAVQSVANFSSMTQPDDTTIKQMLVAKGPLGILINADNLPWSSAGIYHSTNMVVDHAVLLVGYGTTNDTQEDYWIIKNSWGTDSGDSHGFFRLSRNRTENAGLTGPNSLISWAWLP